MVVGSLKRLGALALVVGLLGLNAPAANAGFTVVLDNVSGAGPYTFSYTATIATGDAIVAGDFFRIYDFYGYVPGSIAAPAGWSVSTALSNPTPPPNVILSLGDDPTIPNLIFTYSGATPILGPQTIAGFTAQSDFNFLGQTKNYAGRNTQAGGSSAGQPVDSVGSVRVPGVPEPSAMI